MMSRAKQSERSEPILSRQTLSETTPEVPMPIPDTVLCKYLLL